MGLFDFVRQKAEDREINKTLSEIFPDFRPETSQDKRQVETYHDAITGAMVDVNGTDRWRVHAVKGRKNAYHITPDEGNDCIVRLENGSCIVEEVIEDEQEPEDQAPWLFQ
jgi:hypothetical protein